MTLSTILQTVKFSRFSVGSFYFLPTVWLVLAAHRRAGWTRYAAPFDHQLTHSMWGPVAPSSLNFTTATSEAPTNTERNPL